MTPTPPEGPDQGPEHNPDGRCLTCDGHGMIGGWEGTGNDMSPVGYPCPDCAKSTEQTPEQRIAELERQLAEARAELQKAKEWNRLTELEVKNLRSIVSDQDEDTQKLKAQLAASEKDRERLDWLERAGGQLTKRAKERTHDDVGIFWNYENGDFDYEAKSLRAAIDEAMKGAENDLP